MSMFIYFIFNVLFYSSVASSVCVGNYQKYVNVYQHTKNFIEKKNRTGEYKWNVDSLVAALYVKETLRFN